MDTPNGTACCLGGERRAFADVVFDSSAHCGAGHEFRQVAPAHFRCRSRVGFAPYSWRLHLRIESPGDGREITLEVADFNHFGQELWQEAAAVVSPDGVRWADLGTERIRIVPWTPTGIAALDDTIDDGWHPPYGVRFHLRLDTPTLWFATPVPYTLEHSRQHLAALAARCDFFQVAELGPSHYSDRHGYPLQCVRVGRPGSDADRLRIVVVAGEHPAESAGMYACEGLLEELLHTHDLLADFSFWVVPVANVDGVAFGRTYHNVDPADPARPGVNLNRDWQIRSQPEIQALWRLLEEVRPHLFLSLHNGRHRRELELIAPPQRGLAVLLRHLRAHSPLPLECWRPADPPGMGCRAVVEAGLAEQALCLETLLLRKAPECATFPDSYRRVGMGILRGIVAGLREWHGRPHRLPAVTQAGTRPLRCRARDFVAQLPAFYYSDRFAELPEHQRCNLEINGLPLVPGHYDALLQAEPGVATLAIIRADGRAESLRAKDGWFALRSLRLPGHRLALDYECPAPHPPFHTVLVCPEGMPAAEAAATALDFGSYVRDTRLAERHHLHDWRPFHDRLRSDTFGKADLAAMATALIDWTASRQVTDPGHPHVGAVHSEEDKYDARDTAATCALFAREAQRTGTTGWLDRALLARQYVYRNQMHEPGNLPRHGGFVHMVQGIWGVHFARLEPPFPGIDGVDTCAVVHLLCRAAECGLPLDAADRQALREATQWIANSEAEAGSFLHHEGARHDCQNMNALALSALARAHATLAAVGEQPPADWLAAAARGLEHYLDGQEAIGVWPYLFAQTGARGQAYSEANLPDHGIGLYHLTRALHLPPLAGHPRLPDALRRAARWYLCMAWLDGDTIDLDYNKRPDLGSDICFSGFTWCRFTAAATLLRLVPRAGRHRPLEGPGPAAHGTRPPQALADSRSRTRARRAPCPSRSQARHLVPGGRMGRRDAHRDDRRSGDLTMARTRFAIIGAGTHAKASHYRDPGLRHRPDEIGLCAACDLDPAKLAFVAQEFAVAATYTDYREMIAKEQPDATVIVLPAVLLPDVARACLELGQHVIVEKPPGCNWAEAQSILDTANACGRKAAVSLDRRFFPVVQLLKRRLVPEKINHFGMTYNKGLFGWGAPTNLFTADAIHLIDLFRYLGGSVEEVHAYASRKGEKHLRSFAGTLKLAAGGVGTFNCHYSLPAGRHGRRQLFEVTSDGFSAYLDLGPTMAESPYGGTGHIIDGTDERPVEKYFAEVAGEPDPPPVPRCSTSPAGFAARRRRPPPSRTFSRP